MALLIGEQSSNGFQRAFWLHFSFFSIFVTVLILLFVYCERCQTLYMHLTNDHFVSQTTGEHFLWFVFFFIPERKQTKERKGRKKRWKPTIFQRHSMAFLRHARRQAPMHCNRWKIKQQYCCGTVPGEDLGVCTERILIPLQLSNSFYLPCFSVNALSFLQELHFIYPSATAKTASGKPSEAYGSLLAC